MSDTPQETLERTYSLINEQLADDLLSEVMQQSPAFFEQLVVDLMKAMDYGDGFVTKYSGDGGVDGIIHEDKLGFNLIYIQAKRWDPSTTIGKPELQKFAGAMMGPPKIEKGLFITTAKFSQGAKDFANAQHIILVDGQKPVSYTHLPIKASAPGICRRFCFFYRTFFQDQIMDILRIFGLISVILPSFCNSLFTNVS